MAAPVAEQHQGAGDVQLPQGEGMAARVLGGQASEEPEDAEAGR